MTQLQDLSWSSTSLEIPKDTIVSSSTTDFGMKSSYTRISDAGRDKSKEQTTELLLPKLVVVKVCKPFSIRDATLNHDATFLKAIQQQSPNHSMEDHFFRLVDEDVAKQKAEQLVMSTSPLCCTMSELKDRFDSMPEDFLWLCYVQLHGALDFLHHKCNPPIVHNDLHTENIVVTLSNPQLGLPVLKLIDFGVSSFIEVDKPSGGSTSHLFRGDIYRLLLTLDHIIHSSDTLFWDDVTCKSLAKTSFLKNKTPEFYSFHDALGMSLDRVFQGGRAVQLKLWDEFGTCAMQRVATIPELSKKQIHDSVLFVVKPGYETIQQKVQEALVRPNVFGGRDQL